MSDKIRKLLSEGPSRIERDLKKDKIIESERALETDEKSRVEFVVRGITPQMKKNIQIVIDSKITPEDLETLTSLSEEQKKLFTIIQQCGPAGIDAICQLADDEKLVRSCKLWLLTLMHKLSKKETIARVFKKIDRLIRSVRQFNNFYM